MERQVKYLLLGIVLAVTSSAFAAKTTARARYRNHRL